MRAYSRDLRLRVLNACLEGDCSQREVAQRFDVSRGFVARLLRRYNETGEVTARDRSGGRRRKIGEKEQKVLREVLRESPDATLNELCELLHVRTDVEVSVATMHRAVKALEKRAIEA